MRPPRCTNAAAPTATSTMVRRPALRWRYCRSSPIKAPKTNATPSATSAFRNWPVSKRSNGLMRASDRRTPPGPWRGALELAGEADHQRVLRLAADELHPDRQAAAAHGQRHAGGRLAGDVEGLGVRHEGEQAPRIAVHVRRIARQVADRHGGRAQRGADQDVVVLEEAGDGAAQAMGGAQRLDVERAADGATALVAGPGDRLDLVLGDGTAAPGRHGVEVGGDAGADHHPGGGERGAGDRRGW